MQAAAQLELSCGMTVTHAQSLIPDLTVIDATPEEDEAALMRLALWCIKYLAAWSRPIRPMASSSMWRARRICFRAKRR